MLEYLLSPDEALLVAARGSTETDGLFHWQIQNKEWVGKQMATVDQLSTLISHPFLPVVYGLSGMLESGYLHAWSVFGDVGTEIGMKSTLGGEPCHLAIDPSGKFLVIANYTSSALAVQELDFNGEFLGEIKLTELQGGSVDPDRQDAAHPHQVLFLNQYLIVIDLGSDLVRKFVFDPSKGASNCLSTIEIGKLPAGTGPRHAVVLPDNRLAISGELNETLSVGHPNGSETDWSICPSTRQTGKAKTRPPRNYPGDIKASIDGQKVYFANRGMTQFQLLMLVQPARSF